MKTYQQLKESFVVKENIGQSMSNFIEPVTTFIEPVTTFVSDNKAMLGIGASLATAGALGIGALRARQSREPKVQPLDPSAERDRADIRRKEQGAEIRGSLQKAQDAGKGLGIPSQRISPAIQRIEA